jgi:hypothetical protein
MSIGPHSLMSKTPVGSQYAKALASLNDQLCYFLFARQLVIQRLGDFSPAAGRQMLPAVFATNDYAQKINVRLDQLREFHTKHERATFGAYLSTSYEVTTGFLGDALDLLLKANAASVRKKAKPDTPEDRYWLTMSASSCLVPDDRLRLTLSYIRLRRNHFIHQATNIGTPLGHLLRTSGSPLNAFWGKTLQHLDFASTDMTFHEGDTIEMLKLLRIIVRRLDVCLAGSLNPSAVNAFVAEALFQRRPSRINRDVIAERTRKLRAVLKQQYGGECPEAEASQLARTVGVR